MSSQRHLHLLRAPIIVTYGTHETPEFQRQNRDFAGAVKAAGKPVGLVEAPHVNYFEIMESLGNPYGPNGRAALCAYETLVGIAFGKLHGSCRSHRRANRKAKLFAASRYDAIGTKRT